MVRSPAVRILLDYRPALRQRSGVGEYVLGLARALTQTAVGDEITLFSSSWRDRLGSEMVSGAEVVDRRFPVRLLNLGWHRFEWPPVELLTGQSYDVVHSPHPLLLPARDAAQVVTVHDLDFLSHPERTEREVRRDYPALAEAHAHRADLLVVNSAYTQGEVHQRLGIPEHRITVCRPGGPDWEPRTGTPEGGYVLFLGTLEPRKNVGGLLEAWRRVIARKPDAPELVLAGRATAAASGWLQELKQAPLAGRARHLGYVPDAERAELYRGARLLVLPSFEEGFGLPALEAMTVGVPVVAANRGGVPEVLGDAGVLVDPDDPEDLAAGLLKMLTDDPFARACAARGRRRAGLFNWTASARALRTAYERALANRQERRSRERRGR